MLQKERLLFLNKELRTKYQSLDEVDWYYVSGYYRLSESFMREFQDMIVWSQISVYQKLSEDFIRDFKYAVVWFGVSKYQKLSEDFIREFSDMVYWPQISKYQKLSEDFIREFHDEVDWIYISKFQKLSEDFIREFHDEVDWAHISKFQKLTDEFIREFYNKLDHESIRGNWIYKDTEFLKKQVEWTGLYECHDDYFIAYKGIRSDRYSKYNFQYQYLPGETYEAFCDCSRLVNSFGLSVWTEEDAMLFCSELIVTVKVNYEDVGRIVYDGGKIRCRKITILD